MPGVPALRPTDEVAGAAHLAGTLVDVFTPTVQAVHAGVAHRVFHTLGPASTPIRTLHDAIAELAYTSVRSGAQIVGTLSGIGLALTAGGGERTPITRHPRGALAVAFVNGLLGDQLDGRVDDLVVRPQLVRSAAPSGVEVSTRRHHHDSVTDRVVVFVHGLAETPVGWTWWSDATRPYAERLAGHGWTPIDFTYSTGRSVAESGAFLAAQLAELVADWPVPVSELALIGHSMGGLVVHEACATGMAAECRSPIGPLGRRGHEHLVAGGAGTDPNATSGSWVDQVAHVVTLGAPHSGSWLANLAHRGSTAAARRPETRGISTFLELRSRGIRDLTDDLVRWPGQVDGSAGVSGIAAHVDAALVDRVLVDRVLVDAAPTELAAPVDLAARMPNAQHSFVTAAAPRPIDALVGDGLVHRSSASAPASDRDNVVVRHHRGIGHIRLLNHGAVGDDLEVWMSPRRGSGSAGNSSGGGSSGSGSDAGAEPFVN